jgi:hypothetical protein
VREKREGIARVREVDVVWFRSDSCLELEPAEEHEFGKKKELFWDEKK